VRPCKRCKAPIRYLRTKNDKAAPVDAEPITVTLADLEEGLAVRLLDHMGSNRIHLEGETGYMSHFATCPHADKFKSTGNGGPKRLDEAAPTRLLERMQYIQKSLSRFARHKPSKSEIRLLLDYTKRTVELMEAK